MRAAFAALFAVSAVMASPAQLLSRQLLPPGLIPGIPSGASLPETCLGECSAPIALATEACISDADQCLAKLCSAEVQAVFNACLTCVTKEFNVDTSQAAEQLKAACSGVDGASTTDGTSTTDPTGTNSTATATDGTATGSDKPTGSSESSTGTSSKSTTTTSGAVTTTTADAKNGAGATSGFSVAAVIGAVVAGALL